jgi:hypothetical protein
MPDPVDRAMMERCLTLALQAADGREYPYAAVICQGGGIVCEAVNSVKHDRDVTHHAELLAISKAFQSLGRVSLEDCTIYSNAGALRILFLCHTGESYRPRCVRHTRAFDRRHVALEYSC